MTSNSEKFRTETITTLDHLRRIAPSLDMLAGSGKGYFFHQSAFFIPWCETAAEMGQTPHFFAIWSDAETLVGFVPLCRRRDPKALFAHRLAPPRIGSSPPFDILLAPGTDQDAILQELTRHLSGEKWIDITIPSTLLDSVFATKFASELVRSGCLLSSTPEPSYLKAVGYETFDDFLAPLKSKRRVELKRQYRHFLDAVEFVDLEHPEEMTRASELIRKVVESSWKNKKYLQDTFLPILDKQLLEMSKLGLVHAQFALVEGKPIALLIDFVSLDGSRNAYYNAHDGNFNTLSPGLCLLQFGIRDSIAKGVRNYNFWGNRDYIRRLTKQEDASATVHISRPTMVARLCSMSIKAAINLKSQVQKARQRKS